MSYSKELSYNDYTICFEYEYETNGLTLLSWTAYLGPNEFEIPCQVESNFIEKQLNKWLDKEWSHNGGNYVEEFNINKSMKKCEF